MKDLKEHTEHITGLNARIENAAGEVLQVIKNGYFDPVSGTIHYKKTVNGIETIHMIRLDDNSHLNFYAL